jgi:hypothetical protein
MKFKPVIWIVLIAAAGLGGWFYFHSSKKSGSKAVAQDAGRKLAKKLTFNQVHPVSLDEAAHEDLSASIQPLFISNNSYSQRGAAVRAITTNLTAVDFDALYSFLLGKSSADEEQNGQVLKNQLMDRLCALNPPPMQLADLLAQIYHDRTQNEAIRDYAVQHLATFFEKMDAAPEVLRRTRSFEITEANTVLWEALAETDDSIAGTALLGLERLADSQPDIDAKQVAAAALTLAQDKNAGELSRITALQVCAKMKVHEALPLALEATQSTETVPLRISAIAALGALGTSDQMALLETFIQGADERLKLPAQHALNQINQRLSVASSSH